MIDMLRDRRGFALEATLIVLVLLTALIGAAMAGMLVVQRTAGIDYHGSRVSYAAEAGSDALMAQLEAAVQDGLVTDAELAALTTPVLPPFLYLPPTVTRVGGTVARTITDGPFAGLFGLNQRIDIDIEARDATGNRSNVIVSVNAQSIPLFQFGVFYEEDLEVTNGPPLTFDGWVHTNKNLYLSSANAFYRDIITTPDSVFWQRKDRNEALGGVWINDNTGTGVRLAFDSRSILDPEAFVARSQADFDGRLMTGASGVRPLRLPLPAGMAAVEMVRPRAVGDNEQVRAVKFAWKADWHITVDVTGLATPCLAMTSLPAGRPVPSAVDCPAIFQGRPDAFYEGREVIGVDVLDVNVGALHDWMAADATRRSAILYITFVNAGPGTLTDYPAVRLVNGAQLRFPLTVSTDRPVYVRGDFNAVGWQPASLLGDAVTILSNAWTDAAHPWPAAGFPLTGASVQTRVFAAVAAGHSATPCDWQRPACVPTAPPPLIGSNYGGGLENFPRFLENWGGGRVALYRGSLVSLFQSQYAARRRWSCCTYYSPPTRDWQFDQRFRDPANLPPGTPAVGSVVQTGFRPVYQ